MFLMRHLFAPEWVNLGVYDAFKVPEVCDQAPTCDPNDVYLTTGYEGNCQYQSWAFDQLLDHARENNIYIQLCTDPYTTGFGYETFLWGAHPYVRHFVEPSSATRPYDVEELFYAGGDPNNKGPGTVFYYWKRKYKYMMARWGYSVNIAAIEPFNELDHMLGFRQHDLSGGDLCDVCPENYVNWPADTQLPATIEQWFTDIAHYVRDPVDLNDPVASPLGEDRKLFLASFGALGQAPSYYNLFSNEQIDLIDVHRGMSDAANELSDSWEESQLFRNTYTSYGQKKPFNRGEHNYYANVDADNDPANGKEYETSKIFLNYDVSFHNELWASAFFGNFATGTTWHWERVFWWEDALPKPLDDPNNFFQQNNFSNHLGVTNTLDIGTTFNPVSVNVENRTLHHHFKPLQDFLANPNFPALGFFDGDFSAHRVQPGLDLDYEVYYLMNADENAAIGWVHNARAYWNNNWYVTNTEHNLLGCTLSPSDPSDIQIPGFDTGTDYYVSWFPTRMNTTLCPTDYQWPGSAGSVYLQFGSGDFNAIANNWLDTLHSDFAFVIAPYSVKFGNQGTNAHLTGSEQDFSLYPNPAREVVFVRSEGASPRDIMVTDALGRRRAVIQGTDNPIVPIHLDGLSSGLYFVRVANSADSTTKKLIIQ